MRKRITFASNSRQRCRPIECNNHKQCWVMIGAKGCAKNIGGASRCIACNGIIQIKQWLPPTLKECVT